MHMCDLQAANHQKLKFATHSHGFIRNRPKCGHGSRETHTANVQRILIYKSCTGCAEGTFLSSGTGLSLQLCPCCMQKRRVSLPLPLVLTLGVTQLLRRFSVSTQKVREVLFVKRAQEQSSHPRQLFHANQLAEELTVYFMVMLDIQRPPPPSSSTTLPNINT